MPVTKHGNAGKASSQECENNFEAGLNNIYYVNLHTKRLNNRNRAHWFVFVSKLQLHMWLAAMGRQCGWGRDTQGTRLQVSSAVNLTPTTQPGCIMLSVH